MTHLNYKRQYIHRETKEVLESSQYLKKGVKVYGDIRYFVGGKWVTRTYVPEIRESSCCIRKSEIVWQNKSKTKSNTNCTC